MHGVCSYMVIATVFSRPQLNAVLGKVEKQAAEVWGRALNPATGRSSWEVLDLGDVLVHVMSVDARRYYNLEGFYNEGSPVELPFLSEEEKQQRGDVWTTAF
jgi:ribosome-associated protein